MPNKERIGDKIMSNISNTFNDDRLTGLTKCFQSLVRAMKRGKFDPETATWGKEYLLMYEIGEEINFTVYSVGREWHSGVTIAWMELPKLPEPQENWSGVWFCELALEKTQIVVVDNMVVAVGEKGSSLFFHSDRHYFIDKLGFIVTTQGWVVGSLTEKRRGEQFAKEVDYWRKQTS